MNESHLFTVKIELLLDTALQVGLILACPVQRIYGIWNGVSLRDSKASWQVCLLHDSSA